MTALRIGAKVPSSGPLPASLGIGPMAARLEQAGFDSLWCSDHVVMPTTVASRYPFSDDGTVSWDPQTPWYDAVVAMSLMVAATLRAEVGVAVLVLPLRHPVTFAKQIASIDAQAGGRVALGVGAGWLAEEFAALDVPFDRRGSRLDEWIALLRDCWTGRPSPRDDLHYRLPEGVICEPTPMRNPPILVGGMTTAALRRAGRSGHGWLGLQRAGRLDADAVAGLVAVMRRQAAEAGRKPEALRVCLRIIESVGESGRVAAALPALARAGVDEVIVDCDWDGGGDAERVHDRLRSAASEE